MSEKEDMDTVDVAQSFCAIRGASRQMRGGAHLGIEFILRTTRYWALIKANTICVFLPHLQSQVVISYRYPLRRALRLGGGGAPLESVK